MSGDARGGGAVRGGGSGDGEAGDARERRVRPREARTLSPFTRDDSADMVAVGGCRRPRATYSGDGVRRNLLAFRSVDSGFFSIQKHAKFRPLRTSLHARSRRPVRLSRPLSPPNRTGSQAHPKNVRRRGREPARSAREQDGARGGHPPREEDLRARGASRARQRGRGGVRPRLGLRVRYVSKPRFRSRGRDAGETRARRASTARLRAPHASTTRDRSTRQLDVFKTRQLLNTKRAFHTREWIFRNPTAALTALTN